MAHKASDGQSFTNLPPMKQHQRSLDAKKGMGGGGKDVLKMPGGGGGQMNGEMGADDPAATVAEHGPATEVHMTHDHEMGKHHVHTVHGDAHETHSDHGSAEEAHDHAKAMACSPGEEGGGSMGGMDDAEYE